MATRARAARLAAEAAAARHNNQEQEEEDNPPRDEPPPRDNNRNDGHEDDDLQADDEQRDPRRNEPPQDDSDQGTEVVEDEDESTVAAPIYRPLTSPMELVNLGTNVQTRVITVRMGLSTWKNSWGTHVQRIKKDEAKLPFYQLGDTDHAYYFNEPNNRMGRGMIMQSTEDRHARYLEDQQGNATGQANLPPMKDILDKLIMSQHDALVTIHSNYYKSTSNITERHLQSYRL